MKIVMISDTHGLHDHIIVPDGDMLVHAGDFMNSGLDPSEIRSFNMWLEAQPHRYKVVIAGNHDRLFEGSPEWAEGQLTAATHYLKNSGCEIEGMKIWGSPYTPKFFNWAFMGERGEMHRHWDLIPAGLDLLITHGPPMAILDQINPGRAGGYLGDAELHDAVLRARPKVHVFGHIHGSGLRTASLNQTVFYNAAVLNEKYRPHQRPIQTIDFNQETGTFS